MNKEITVFTKTEAALVELRKRYGGKLYEIAKPAGMKEAKEDRAVVRAYRVDLEKSRKAEKQEALDYGRLLDGEAKRITAKLVELEAPINEQIKKREDFLEKKRQAKVDAEEKRVQDILDRITEIRGAITAVQSMGVPASEKVQEFIDDIEKIQVDDSFAEFIEQAQDAKTATLATLRLSLSASVKREDELVRLADEHAELEQLRSEQEARETERRVAQEKLDAEVQRKREAAAMIEREELEAQRKKQEEEQTRINAEQARLQKERDEIEHAKAVAEGRRLDAEKAARKAKYPGEAAIVAALVDYFGVTEKVIREWLMEVRKAA